MFAHSLQKSGTISFYDDEDSVKKVKEIIFAGAFCVEYKEKFESTSGKPFCAYITLSAGGVKTEESVFRFPWFKGALVAGVDYGLATMVEEVVFDPNPKNPPKVLKPFEEPKPWLLHENYVLIPTDDERLKFPPSTKTDYVVKQEDIIVEEMSQRLEKFRFKLWDKNSGAKIAFITMPIKHWKGGPDLSINIKYAPDKNEKLHNLTAYDFRWTPVRLELLKELSMNKFNDVPINLPADFFHDNLASFQKQYALLSVDPAYQRLFPKELGTLAVKKMTYAIHSESVGYGDFICTNLMDFRDTMIGEILYKEIPHKVSVVGSKNKNN